MPYLNPESRKGLVLDGHKPCLPWWQVLAASRLCASPGGMSGCSPHHHHQILVALVSKCTKNVAFLMILELVIRTIMPKVTRKQLENLMYEQIVTPKAALL